MTHAGSLNVTVAVLVCVAICLVIAILSGEPRPWLWAPLGVLTVLGVVLTAVFCLRRRAEARQAATGYTGLGWSPNRYTPRVWRIWGCSYLSAAAAIAALTGSLDAAYAPGWFAVIVAALAGAICLLQARRAGDRT